MKKFIRTCLISLSLLLAPLAIIPNETDNTLLEIVQSETPESTYLRKEFNVNILDKENIKQYPIISPVTPQDITRISSFYGDRIHPIYNTEFFHRGIDLAANEGAIVLATGNGVVTGAEKLAGYGNQIIIDHGNDYMTRYAHLSTILVNKGDLVQIGDIIGQVGSTGLSTGNHLHYEIIHNKKCIDPLSIHPNTLQDEEYLSYLDKVNSYFLRCSDNMSNRAI